MFATDAGMFGRCVVAVDKTARSHSARTAAWRFIEMEKLARNDAHVEECGLGSFPL